MPVGLQVTRFWDRTAALHLAAWRIAQMQANGEQLVFNNWA